MTKKAQIIIAILAGTTVILLVIIMNLLFQDWLDNVRQDAFDVATSQVVGKIITSIEQKGEVIITVPDGNGGTKSMVLVLKGE